MGALELAGKGLWGWEYRREPWEGEFITFGDSNKMQKAKPEEQRLEAIKCLRRSKQGKR